MKFKITFLLPLSLFVYTISMRQKITISSFVRDRSFPFNDTIRYIASFNAENLSAKGNTRLNLFMQQSTGNLAEIVISANKNNPNQDSREERRRRSVRTQSDELIGKETAILKTASSTKT